MNKWRKQAGSIKAINWILIAAVLVMVLFPSHFHFHHHHDEATNHDNHVIDLHLDNFEAIDSLDEDDALNFTTVAIDKKSSSSFTPLVLFLVLFTLIPLLSSGFQPNRFTRTLRFNSLFYFVSPPLRAPPQN
jgi:hypothetical protein